MTLPWRSGFVATLVAAVALFALSASPPASAASGPPPRVTLFGDSVQASFGFSDAAVRNLSRGLRVRVEAEVCRSLVSPGCFGGSPPSALALAEAIGPGLGDVAIVNVGYNDFGRRYNIDQLMGVFRRSGVRAVVWVTLRETRPSYVATNAMIRAAARRAERRGDLPVVRVVDWHAQSSGRAWFASDGIHLNSAGALGLSALLRENVLAALADVGTSVDGRPVTVRTRTFPLGRSVDRIVGSDTVLWFARRGVAGAIEGRSGRRLPLALRLGEEETLAPDGRLAWLKDPGSDTLTRPVRTSDDRRGSTVDGLGEAVLLARAGRWLWAVEPCGDGDMGCLGGQRLHGVNLGDGRRRDVPLGQGRVLRAAADGGALWLLVTNADRSAARLERRDPRTGALRMATRLPRSAATAAIVAGRRAAWVLTRNRQLLRIDRSGRARRTLGRVRSVAGQGDKLWVLRTDGRTLLNLAPVTGRPRAKARSARRLSGELSFTRDYLWALERSRRRVLQVPRV